MKTPLSLLALISVSSLATLASRASEQPGSSTPDSPTVPRESRDALQEKVWAPGSPGRADNDQRKPTPRQDGQGGEDDAFARLDTDHDGRISAVEFSSSETEALERIADGKRRGTRTDDGGFGLANNEGRPDRAKIFRELDTDKDDSLSRAEWEVSSASAEKRSE